MKAKDIITLCEDSDLWSVWAKADAFSQWKLLKSGMPKEDAIKFADLEKNYFAHRVIPDGETVK